MTRPAFAAAAGVLVCALAVGCGGGPSPPSSAPAPSAAAAPNDAAHQALMGPHGDHTPRHGGLVLMNGDVHYEVIIARDGRHQIWFSDAVRNELPASVATGVTMEVARPGAPVEIVTLRIDDSGEAWVAAARAIAGEGVMVKVRYSLQGEAHEVEVPVVAGSSGAK